jgi:hypothetical protein
MALQADEARKAILRLPARQPKRLRGYNALRAFWDRGKGKEVITWLHKINGDAFTGRSKRAFREELGFADTQDEGATTRFVDRKELEIVVQIEDFERRAMELSYLEGLSDVEFTASSQLPKEDLVVVRWQVIGKHTGTLLGVPPTNQEVTITGMTMLKFEEQPRPEGGRIAQATDEWTYWDLPALMQQLGVTP